MRAGVIVFSRMDSSRLPGKALIDIFGRPLLGRVIDRAKHIKGAERIIVATSSRSIDNPITSFAESEGVDIYRGNVNDVAGRAIEACKCFGLTKFARICGDRPFFDPELVSRLLKIHNDLDIDIVTTMFPRTYPPGLTVEVISTKALRNAISMMKTPEDKEDVTSFFYRNPLDFSIKNIDAPNDIDFSGLNLCVDNALDLSRAEWIASHTDNLNSGRVDMRTVISYAKEWYKSSKDDN